MKTRIPASINPQLTLPGSEPEQLNDNGQLAETFRRLYYHLYSNSNTSRADRIMDDISLILLSKLVAEKSSPGNEDVNRYRQSAGTADEILIPLLHTQFPRLIDSQRRFNLEDEPIRWVFNELEGVDLKSSPAHVLGDAFQALVGSHLRGAKGQFFTPQSLVRTMVRVIAPKSHESVLDPACGTGGFLAEAHIYQSQLEPSEPLTGQIIGIDKDYDLARISAAVLEVTTAGRASVFHCNSLDPEEWENSIRPERNDLFDVILTNPPFGARIGIRDTEILRQFALGHRWTRAKSNIGWSQTSDVLLSQAPQILFLELCVTNLKPGGRLGIVLPEGVFGNRGQGYIWSWIRGQGRIFALLDCPRTTFQPSTDTKTNVLFFEKMSGESIDYATSDRKVRVAVAIYCGHDRRGRSNLSDGSARPDDFRRLGDQYHDEQSTASGWQEVLLKDSEYIVPRYHIERDYQSPEEKKLIGHAATASLADLVSANLLTIRKGHEPGSDAYGTGDIPFVRTSDITNLEISADPTNGVNEETYNKLSVQQQLKPSDVLIVVDGRYKIGMTALITANNHRCVVQSHFRILSTPNPEVLNCYELLFALNLPSVRVRIRDLVFIQSTLGTLGKRLLELKIPILSGNGPWRERVDRFKEILIKRDQLLAELSAINDAHDILL